MNKDPQIIRVKFLDGPAKGRKMRIRQTQIVNDTIMVVTKNRDWFRYRMVAANQARLGD